MAQGALPFEYQVSPSASGLTALAGLPAVLDLAATLDLDATLVESGRRLQVLLSEAARRSAEILIQARSRFAIVRPPKPAT